ncbi:MAG: hypothetical protein KGL39_23485 [Patescibacteria group bacterium]|nr:hypothetical protein [Patescibacteria group bacterium]
MYSFVVNFVLVAAFGVMVYLLALALPRVKTDEESGRVRRKLVRSVHLEKIDEAVKKSYDKLLRRLKVLILRADNIVSRKLNNNDNKL